MKKFSNVFESKVNIQAETCNFIASPKLKKYLKVANNFLSDDAKSVIDYLIDHNDTYIKDFSNAKSDNALADFIDRHSPKTDEEKNLLKSLNTLNKKGRLLEVPVFQTQDQFLGIINGEISADEVIIDLTTEQGRNAITKQYMPLIHKVIKQYYGKSNLDYDELMSAALLGFTKAMNSYGKRSEDTKADDAKLHQYTFGQYAAQWVRIEVIGDIRNNSRTVRIPVSAQNREKEETGKITKSNSISGDESFSDDENSKSLFDIINDFTTDSVDSKINKEDMQKLWKSVYNAIDKKFDDKMKDVFYSFYGIHGYKKLKNKEIADKYNVTSQNISYYLYKINKYLTGNTEIFNKLKDLYELYKECLHDMDADGTHEPYITSYVTETFEDFAAADFNNMLWKFSTWFKLGDNKQLIIDILLKSVLEMDETKCRQSINCMLTNEDALSQTYVSTIKNFINFMYDIVEENQTIDYADKVVRVARMIGKDRLEAINSFMNESSTLEEKSKLKEFMNSIDSEDISILTLIKYYGNHFNDILNDSAEILNSKEIKDQINKLYLLVCGKNIENIIDELITLCKYWIDINK